MSKKIFEDGSSIEWVDKENIKYSEAGFSVLIWVDVEPGLFSSGRIIKSSSFPEWISKEKKNEIIEKIKKYYRKCRLEI